MKSHQSTVLKAGLGISAGMIILSLCGLLGFVPEDSSIRPMIPIGLSLGIFNLIGCYLGLRKASQ
jgi:hypothetical protein